MLEAAVTKKLREFTLDVCIHAKPGEIVALMGENGAGKSTALNIIAGLMAPDTGSVRLGDTAFFDGTAGIDVPVEDRRIGYVCQSAAVFPHMTVAANVAFGLHAWHMPHDRAREQVGHWLEQMNITGLASVRAGELSGGQKQRVALARAFAIGPRLLLLDEPLTALDTTASHKVIHLIQKSVAATRIPCIIVTHRITDAVKGADRVYLLERGRISWEGVPGEMPGCSCEHCEG